MKLKRLTIYNYKNLEDITVSFTEDNTPVYVFIGKNGSGKSNLLEAISGIFANLFDSKLKIDVTYAIEYEINSRTVYIENKDKFVCKVDDEERNLIYLNNNSLLPSRLISVYSGEESRMWEKFYFPYYENYIKSIIDGNVKSSELRLMYINKYYWNIALLTLLLSELQYNERFIRDDLNIGNVNEVVFLFNHENIKKNREPRLKLFLDQIRGKNRYSIEELRNIMKGTESTDSSYPNDELSINELEVFNKLMMAFMPKNFKTIENIKIVFNDRLTVEDLSEGEKKRLLIKLVLGVLSDENSLILFDEPDAFLHPSWQKSLITYIKENGENKAVIITTHSPNVISDVSNRNVLIMANGKVYPSIHKTLGRDVNSIQSEVMDTPVRNEQAAESIKIIYDLIHRGDLDAAEEELNILASTQMGENDLEIIKIRTMIDFEREFQ